VRRFYAEIDKGNIGIIDELVDENYIDDNPPPYGCRAAANASSSHFVSFRKATRDITKSKTKSRRAIASLPGSRRMGGTRVIFQERRK
jgi:hypothetical protein